MKPTGGRLHFGLNCTRCTGWCVAFRLLNSSNCLMINLASSCWFLLQSPPLTRFLSHTSYSGAAQLDYSSQLTVSRQSTHCLASDKKLRSPLICSSPNSLRTFLAHLHLKKRCAPSSSYLWQRTHLVSNSIPLLLRLPLRAKELFAKRSTN
jgi:hypothetical protein